MAETNAQFGDDQKVVARFNDLSAHVRREITYHRHTTGSFVDSLTDNDYKGSRADMTTRFAPVGLVVAL